MSYIKVSLGLWNLYNLNLYQSFVISFLFQGSELKTVSWDEKFIASDCELGDS